MTHAEATATAGVRGPGVHLSTCPGELVPIETQPDFSWDHRRGRAVDRTVTVLRCERCQRRVSIGVTADGAVVLNDYALAGDSLVRELAAAWDVKPILPRTEEEP